MHVTTALDFVGELPTEPAIYALHGGSGRSRHVAYVGVTGDLRSRIRQHFIRRDSSIVTGTSAASLNPDLVTKIAWWLHPEFSDKTVRRATEIIALNIFEPALRSRGKITSNAESLSEDTEFRQEMRDFLDDGPTGAVVLPTLSDALEQIQNLHERIEELEDAVDELRK